MDDNNARFQELQADIYARNAAMKDIVVNSQFGDDGQVLSDVERIRNIPKLKENHPMFRALSDDHLQLIVSGMQSSVREYNRSFGELPRPDVLASAHKSMENILLAPKKTTGATGNDLLLESVGEYVNGVDGHSSAVEVRAATVGVILPAMLSTITIDAAVSIPANHNQVEIFKLYRRAGKNFGDLKKGDEIDPLTEGQYSKMRQRYPFASGQLPDGSRTEFVFDTASDLPNTSKSMPIRKYSVALYVDRKKIAKEQRNTGNKIMCAVMVEDTEVIINGSIDHEKGVCTFTSTQALPVGMLLDIEFDVDVETDPNLIPDVIHDIEGRTIEPYEYVVNGDASIQTMFTMQREFTIDERAMFMTNLRNLIANEKARSHLNDMLYNCTHESELNMRIPAGEEYQIFCARLSQYLTGISNDICRRTKTVGLTGIICGSELANFFKSLTTNNVFVPPKNYRETNDIQYAGLLFGRYRIFESPVEIEPLHGLCYGRGSTFADAGYVAGDAISPTNYNHPIGKNLRQSNTLYGLSYGEMQPFDGECYFHKIIAHNTIES